jgi:hypothetical protein
MAACAFNPFVPWWMKTGPAPSLAAIPSFTPVAAHPPAPAPAPALALAPILEQVSVAEPAPVEPASVVVSTLPVAPGSTPAVVPTMVIAEGGDLSGFYMTPCPHCRGSIIVAQNEVNCAIFRHAILKSGGVANPHMPQNEAEKLLANGEIWGCGFPFRLVDGEAQACEWI